MFGKEENNGDEAQMTEEIIEGCAHQKSKLNIFRLEFAQIAHKPVRYFRWMQLSYFQFNLQYDTLASLRQNT